MKKLILLLLTGALLITAASAGAEYKDHRLTEGSAADSGIWACYPLDADNAIVIARSFRHPWHVSWYRDGRLYRDLSGSTDDLNLIPVPVIGQGSEFLLLRSSPKEGASRDTKSYSSHLVRWTEEGLERVENLPDSRPAVCYRGSVLIRNRAGSTVLQHDGKETVLPAGIADSPNDRISECVPLEEDVFLLEVLKKAQGNNVLVCVDRGKVRYRLKIPSEYYAQIPDGQGGFLSTVDWPSGDYSPVKLNHYDRAGRMDRTLELSGREVAVEVFGSVADRDTGLCTLYGTAVANSRKVYTAFAMTLDADLNVTGLDVRKIDPDYRDYCPTVYLAPDGTAHVYITDVEQRYGLRPVLMPFSLLEESRDDYGLTLR